MLEPHLQYASSSICGKNKSYYLTTQLRRNKHNKFHLSVPAWFGDGLCFAKYTEKMFFEIVGELWWFLDELSAKLMTVLAVPPIEPIFRKKDVVGAMEGDDRHDLLHS